MCSELHKSGSFISFFECPFGKRLAAYGWRGERLNKEVARIVAGPDILPERRDYSIIFPYGWEKKQLTREMRRMFPRKTGRRVLIMLDELHQFIDSREKQ